jgi:hypothetical protein
MKGIVRILTIIAGLSPVVSIVRAQDFPPQPAPLSVLRSESGDDPQSTVPAASTGKDVAGETATPASANDAIDLSAATSSSIPQPATVQDGTDTAADPDSQLVDGTEAVREDDPDVPLRPFWTDEPMHPSTAGAMGDAEVADVSTQDPDVERPADDPSLVGPPVPDPDANEYGVSPMEMLGKRIPPATRERLSWTTGQSFSGSVMETPVIVVHGIKPGPRLCLTAGVHGDELNGVEVVRRLAYKNDPELLAGTVIAVPIVNLLGFSRGTRYLPDRRDLNRFFPGSVGGSSASRIAHGFFQTIIRNCDALVDFHTGSFDRANLPQVRGDLAIPAVVEFTRGFGATAVLHSPGAVGMLRYAATAEGIPSVTFEIGAPMRLQPEEIEHGVQAIETLMYKMGMIEDRQRWAEPQAVFYESRWVRVDHGGMLFSQLELGDRVRRGQVLGQVIDPVSNRLSEIRAPDDGRIIGMALNQLVLPGFAAYHIGVAADEEHVVSEAEGSTVPGDERFMEYDQLDEEGADRGDPEAEDDQDAAIGSVQEESENER